jgi:RHS repeat-associated protein
MKYPSPTASRADLTLATDYYPFGAAMPGRSFSEGEYRFGFQGQEKDDELKGEGNSINYKYRMHDARIGRFFAVDPLAPEYPWNSTYAFSENRVIDGLDLEGLEYISYWEARIKVNSEGIAVIRISTMSDRYQETYDRKLAGVGHPVYSMTTDEYLDSREYQQFNVLKPDPMSKLPKSVVESNLFQEEYKLGNKKIKPQTRLNSGPYQTRGARGALLLEVSRLGVEGYLGWNAMYDHIDIAEENAILDKQFDQLFLAYKAISDYIESFEGDKSIFEGENLVNLTNYVLYGEMAGDNNEVFEHGNKIIDKAGKNEVNNPKIRKPEGDDKK